jgi:hypothetical protein
MADVTAPEQASAQGFSDSADEAGPVPHPAEPQAAAAAQAEAEAQTVPASE